MTRTAKLPGSSAGTVKMETWKPEQIIEITVRSLLFFYLLSVNFTVPKYPLILENILLIKISFGSKMQNMQHKSQYPISSLLLMFIQFPSTMNISNL